MFEPKLKLPQQPKNFDKIVKSTSRFFIVVKHKNSKFQYYTDTEAGNNQNCNFINPQPRLKTSHCTSGKIVSIARATQFLGNCDEFFV